MRTKTLLTLCIAIALISTASATIDLDRLEIQTSANGSICNDKETEILVWGENNESETVELRNLSFGVPDVINASDARMSKNSETKKYRVILSPKMIQDYQNKTESYSGEIRLVFRGIETIINGIPLHITKIDNYEIKECLTPQEKFQRKMEDFESWLDDNALTLGTIMLILIALLVTFAILRETSRKPANR